MELLQSTWILDTTVGSARISGIAQADISLPPEAEAAQRFLTCQVRIESASGQAKDGEVLISGVAAYTLIYENASGLTSMVSRNAFEQSLAIREVQPGDSVKVLVTPQSCQARWSDERSCTVEAMLQLHAWATRRTESSFLSEAAGENVYSRTAALEGAYLLGHSSHSEALRTDAELPPGKPDAIQVLNASGWAEVEELSIQAGQAHARGSTHIQILYASQGKAPVTEYAAQLPFELAWDAPELAGSHWLTADGNPGTINIRVYDNLQGEKRILAIEAEVNLRIAGWAEESGQVLEDAFSPQEEVLLVQEEWEIIGAPIETCRDIRVSAPLRLPEGSLLPGAVYAVLAQPVVDTWQTEDGMAQVEGHLAVQALVQSGELLTSLAGSVPFHDRFALESGASWPRITVLSVSGVLGAEGLSIKAHLVLCPEGNAVTRRTVAVGGTVQPWASAMPKGLMLVVASSGEDRWSLAKRCRIAPKDLTQYNPQLAAGSLKGGECVVIEH